MNGFKPVFLSYKKGKFTCSPSAYIQSTAVIDCSGDVTIKDKVYIAFRVRILTHSRKIASRNETVWEVMKHRDYIKAINLVIEEEVWIYSDALILPQVRKIGKGAYIGARAVVTKDIPPYEIWAGNPARKIGERTYSHPNKPVKPPMPREKKRAQIVKKPASKSVIRKSLSRKLVVRQKPKRKLVIERKPKQKPISRQRPKQANIISTKERRRQINRMQPGWAPGKPMRHGKKVLPDKRRGH